MASVKKLLMSQQPVSYGAMATLKARLLGAVVITASGCWEWPGYCFDNGYGKIGVDFENRYFHRAMWALHKGPIPEGMMVLHRCDNRPCGNPDHLFLGTNLENNRDALMKGRSSVGDRHATKLASMQVLEIRKMYKPGVLGFGQKALAAQFGVSRRMVQAIVQNKVWNHIGG